MYFEVENPRRCPVRNQSGNGKGGTKAGFRRDWRAKRAFKAVLGATGATWEKAGLKQAATVVRLSVLSEELPSRELKGQWSGMPRRGDIRLDILRSAGV